MQRFNPISYFSPEGGLCTQQQQQKFYMYLFKQRVPQVPTLLQTYLCTISNYFLFSPYMKHSSISYLSSHMALNTFHKVTPKIVFPNFSSINPAFDLHSNVSSGPLNLCHLGQWHQTQKLASVPLSLTPYQFISRPCMCWIYSFLSVWKPTILIQWTIISHLEYSNDNEFLPRFAVFTVICFCLILHVTKKKWYWNSDLTKLPFNWLAIE